MVILPRASNTQYIDAEWWWPSNPDVRSYGRLGIYRHPSGEVARLELVSNPVFTGALFTERELFATEKSDTRTALWGRELGTEKPISLLALTHDVHSSSAALLITDCHVAGLDAFELKTLTASSECLYRWAATSCWESFQTINTPESQTLLIDVPKKAIWAPPAAEGHPTLELRLAPSVTPTPVGLSLGLTTNARFSGQLTAGDAFKSVRELAIFVSICLGERFEFEKVYIVEPASIERATIVVTGDDLPKQPYFHYAPVSLATVQNDPSSFARFKALCSASIELVTELYSRFLSPKAVGETDVLRQVAMSEGLARLVFGENGTPGLLANKAQLELWKRKNKATQKGYSETGITIRRAVDHLPPELLAVAQKALQCSGADEIAWAKRFERLVKHRHTASHFLHSLPVGYAPTGDEFFRDWHASKMLAYLLCLGFLGFDAGVHRRVATLEAWKRPSRAGETPVTT